MTDYEQLVQMLAWYEFRLYFTGSIAVRHKKCGQTKIIGGTMTNCGTGADFLRLTESHQCPIRSDPERETLKETPALTGTNVDVVTV